MPACLPEQLLQSGVSAIPSRTTRSATAAEMGAWGPQARSASVAPIRRSRPLATSRCLGSLECEAHASASSSLVIPSASAAPSSSSGNA
jgi:hypothetical protein